MVGRLNPEAPSPYLYPEPTDRLRPPYHSVIGDRGKNRDAKSESSDGVVPYWSSHFDGAQSEKIVPSNHSAHTNPEAIAEFKRILRLLLGR